MLRFKSTSMSSGLSKMIGFGIGIALFGVTSLIAIPSMIRASGPDAWAAIAVGQAIGGVAAAIIAYGSLISGPAAVARADRVHRMTEFLESLRTRLSIFVPVTIACCVLTAVSAGSDEYLAALGCISICAIGLTSVWYFVGTGQPYVLLYVETIPRVLGTVVGIVLMNSGMSAAAGLYSQIAGMALGVAISSVYVLHWPASAGPKVQLKPLSVPRLLIERRHGVTASTTGALYNALPIVIVGFVTPASLSAYAVLFKLQRQFSTAMSPVQQVLQGWVPRAGDRARYKRAKQALAGAIGLGVILALVLTVAGRPIVQWLGDGQIYVAESSIFLTALTIGFAVTENITARTCLVPFDLVRVMAHITLWGSVLGLSAVALFGWLWGINGVLAGVLLGLVARTSVMIGIFFWKAPDWHRETIGGGAPLEVESSTGA